jgi:hypothetical protein
MHEYAKKFNRGQDLQASIYRCLCKLQQQERLVNTDNVWHLPNVQVARKRTLKEAREALRLRDSAITGG